ncbi:potassium channel family protein [Neptunomonas japonica]|uniref:Voltage-gated ion channel n=1 Tax=Neptunomonas japonica JAMM 1380 TaxID=1441457 RepID=A0A7R6PH29_9GAMM|nr:potassium channel family protein [Neptunomonas japonica]BBB29498.1 voltage-gated ion channel [Neptunomonas japonica JAMM 1380]
MEFSLTFIQLFFWGIYLASPLLLMLCSVFLLLGLIVGHLESWKKFDSLYWAFITAFTVGYGDIRPLKRRSKVLSIMIAGVGIMFTGLIVAITIETSSKAFSMHTDPVIFQQIEQSLK